MQIESASILNDDMSVKMRRKITILSESSIKEINSAKRMHHLSSMENS